MHLAYIWIVSHLSAKNDRNWWKFDEVLTKTNLLSFFGGHGVVSSLYSYSYLLFTKIIVELDQIKNFESDTIGF